MKKFTVLSFALLRICNLEALPQDLLSSPEACQINSFHNSLEITVDHNAQLDWQSFSIAKDELVRFFLPSAQSVVINKVVGRHPSEIFGALFSNGKVYLINPSGIWIGKDAHIDTAGFIASTLEQTIELTDENHLFHFSGAGGGPITIEGDITLKEGDLMIVAPHIKVEGKLACLNGNAFLLGSNNVYVSNEDLDFQFDEYNTDLNSAVVQFNGSLSATAAEETGGQITLSGAVVHIGPAAELNASGNSGGGDIRIGKAPGVCTQEKNSVIIFPEGAQISANALKNGDGGNIILLSEGISVAKGHIESRGGPEGGNGGVIEVSGHELDCTPSVNTTASLGKVGTVIFDPINIEIVPVGDMNYSLTVLPGPIYQYDATASVSTISFATINAALGMADVVIRSSGAPGPELGDLSLFSDYTITPAPLTSNTLTLESYRDLVIAASLIYPTPGSIVLRAVTGGVGIGGAGALQTTNAIVSVSNGDLTVEGSFSVTGNVLGPYYAYAEAPQGTIFVTSPSAGLSVRGANANGAFAQIGSPVATGGAVNSNIFITTQLDFRIIAGNATNAYAKIGHGGTVLPLVPGTLQGNITLSTMDDLFLRGGSAQGAFAAIGHQGGDLGTAVNVSGDITFTISNDAIILGGISPGDAFARVGHGGLDVTSETYSGSIAITAGGQYILVGGNVDSPAVIGHTLDSSTGSVTVSAPLIHVESTGSLPFLMQAGSGLGSDSLIGVFLNSPGAGSTANANIDMVVAGDLNMNPASGPASNQIGLGSGTLPLIGNVTVTVTGDINLNMVGSNGDGGINIDINSPAPSNVVTISANNIYANADTTTAGFSSNGQLNIITEQDFLLNAQGPAGSTRAVGLNGVSISSGNNFTLSSATTLAASASVQAYGGDIFIEAGNDVFLLDSTGTSAPPFSSNIFNFGSGQIDVVAGANMLLQNGTAVGAVSGIINLVVDNLFTPAPLIGPGSLQMLPGSFVIANSGQNIRLFTARQNQNLIQGTFLSGLNSVTGFTGGPLYSNISPEMWGVYYFNSFYYAGEIFTIFYKDFLQEITSAATVVIDELLFGFNPQDEYTEWPDEFIDLWRFEIGYDPALVSKRGKGAYTSRQVLGTEYYWIARQNLHFIKTPKVNRSWYFDNPRKSLNL
jgi:filamentous hemagglutinin family protein